MGNKEALDNLYNNVHISDKVLIKTYCIMM